MKNPVSAPPTCAMNAVLLGLKKECPVMPEIKSKIIMPGIKYLAFMGMGKNIIINSALGFIIPKAAKMPIRHPEAPTMEALNTGKIFCNCESCDCDTPSSTLFVVSMVCIWLEVRPEAINDS